MVVEMICAPRDFPLISILASSFSVGGDPSADGCILALKMKWCYCLRRYSLKQSDKETIVMHAGEWNLQLPTFRLGWKSARDKDSLVQQRGIPGKPALERQP